MDLYFYATLLPMIPYQCIWTFKAVLLVPQYLFIDCAPVEFVMILFPHVTCVDGAQMVTFSAQTVQSAYQEYFRRQKISFTYQFPNNNFNIKNLISKYTSLCLKNVAFCSLLVHGYFLVLNPNLHQTHALRPLKELRLPSLVICLYRTSLVFDRNRHQSSFSAGQGLISTRHEGEASLAGNRPWF